MRNDHRDSIWKLTARICDTLSAFFYQGVIFYVQIACYKESDWNPLSPPNSAEIAWIWIEIYCFYIYIFGVARFIVFHQLLEGVCFKKKSDQSDMNKAINDFIKYEYMNIVWSSLNTVLCIMPIICIFILNPRSGALDLTDSDMSYTVLLTVVCLANILQFALRPRLYYPIKKDKLSSSSKDINYKGKEDA